jgi:two-component system CheB/CheR fusion protein
LFLDEKLNIRFFTPAATSLFSVIASDVGRPLADLAHHFTDGQLLADAKKVLASLTPTTRDIEAESGASYSYRVLPYRTKDNHIEGVVITFVDVTERKQAEDAANAAKLLAQQANLGKSRFLAAASHDLRQPLQTLFLLQGPLAKRMTDKGGANLVAKLEETIGAMSGMLNSLLDINQLEGGFVRPEVASFLISDLLERLKTEFAFHATAKGLDLRVITSRVRLRSDPRLLEQMLRNLLANALKYTDRGKVLLGCRRRGDKLRIEVWDTGIGIPPEQMKAIFREFHQVDNTARERSRGLGLGLAIVERLSDLLSHTVDVRSWPGSGSVFTIDVPIAREGERVRPKIDRDSAKTIAGLVGEILIIEDDSAVRDMLEILFEEEGHRTNGVSNSKEAIALAVRGAVLPDVIVADYNLPGDMTGTQVIARLRQALDREIPGIILTGDISTETLHVISRADCVHLVKPATAEELTWQIQNLLVAKWPQSTRKRGSPAVEGADGSKPTIFLVDDDRNLLNNLQKLLQEHGRIVEAYASASAFLGARHRDRAGCVVIDAIMPGMGGVALLERLKAEDRGLPAIMITGQGDVAMAVQAMKAGAIDFIEKPFRPDQLLASIDRALERVRESTELSAQRRHEAARRLAILTPREREVMNLVIQGQPNKIIAHGLGISRRTVESHRSRLMRRTGVKSLPDLVRLAVAAE